MTPIRRLPSVLGVRRPNTLDQERENMEKIQEASYRKAINDEEAPVKMKHVRKLIIATHEDKSSMLFWKLAHALHPLSADVTAWKFCHTFHMLLRDGHKSAISDALKHFEFVRSIRDHFRHLSHGYGRLVVPYADLLMCKLRFHQRNPQFPSNLSVKPDELHSIAETDANNYFELAVEMFEYTECILNLYEVVNESLLVAVSNQCSRTIRRSVTTLVDSVFNSLDQSRANSNTRMGQCRLAPLIPCIQDSTSLYDLTVRIMFNLHKALAVDLLIGHRDRFSQQFPRLHAFYANSANLQYFRLLNITIPQLPKDPPNFLVEADLASHVAPVVVLLPEADDTADAISDSASALGGFGELLVDTACEPPPPPIPPHPDIVDGHNGSLVDSIAARESLIETLSKESERQRAQLQLERSQHLHAERQLADTINELQANVAKLESSLLAERAAKESILVQVEAAAASAETVTKLQQEEAARRIAEEKFAKMREVYQKLRDEHVTLIRAKADVDRSLHAERSRREAADTSVRSLQERLSQQDNIVKTLHDSAGKEQQNLLEQISQLQKSLEATREESELQAVAVQHAAEQHVGWCVQSAADTAVVVLHQAAQRASSSQHADISCSPELLKALELIHNTECELFSTLKQEHALDLLAATLTDLVASASSLVSQCVDSSSPAEDAVTALTREMALMREAIQEATEATAAMLQQARQQDTGLQLEVNESLLALCMQLLDAVQQLVVRAAALQQEIVQQGKGGASPKDFYKRNHRWTQGLISGAKAVAVACRALMSATDAVVCRGGSLEEVMVSSREVAASSMQLVMASKVKASSDSEALINLNQAAKAISTITGNLVATAENCRDKVNNVSLDFSKLSLHQAKRLEMDMLVKVLEAEKNLEIQREKLSRLRKHHYQQSGDAVQNENSEETS